MRRYSKLDTTFLIIISPYDRYGWGGSLILCVFLQADGQTLEKIINRFVDENVYLQPDLLYIYMNYVSIVEDRMAFRDDGNTSTTLEFLSFCNRTYPGTITESTNSKLRQKGNIVYWLPALQFNYNKETKGSMAGHLNNILFTCQTILGNGSRNFGQGGQKT